MGVTPTPGGSHDGLGTANALLAIGNGAYLEIIGPDPSQPDHVGPRPFGVDDVTEPRLITWAAAVPDLDLWLAWCTARKLDPGPASPCSARPPLGMSFTGGSPFLPVMATASCPSSSSGPGPRRPRQLRRESSSWLRALPPRPRRRRAAAGVRTSVPRHAVGRIPPSGVADTGGHGDARELRAAHRAVPRRRTAESGHGRRNVAVVLVIRRHCRKVMQHRRKPDFHSPLVCVVEAPS